MLDPEVLSRLRDIVGTTEVISDPADLVVYECDGYTLAKDAPVAVVLPRTADQVSAVARYLHGRGIPFLARGTGTGLSGGCIPAGGGVVIGLGNMNRILGVDIRNRRVVVESGAINLNVTHAVSPRGYHFAPDPASQMSATIGGNVAENAGGPHTLKYGVTVNHVLGLELVLPDGEIVEVGGQTEDTPGYDLTGVFIGSEGTFGICTKATLRILRKPQACRTLLAIFPSLDDASRAVSGIIAAGILPVALELMDRLIIHAVEEAFHFGFPDSAEAVLILELDGLEAGLHRQMDRARDISQQNHATEIKSANSERERLTLWASRKKAFGAIGRLSPNFCTQDGVVPRTRLPEMLRTVHQISRKHGIRIANVAHAGDGNIHPILLFDDRNPDEVRRTLLASDEIMRACVGLGGTVTGEHGIGLEKIRYMPLLYGPEDLAAMAALKRIFDPAGRMNPHKVLPGPDGTGAATVAASPGRQAPL